MASRLLSFNPKEWQASRPVRAAFLLFFARVAPSIAQCALACNQNVQVALDQSGQLTVPVAMVAPYAAQNCTGTLELSIFNSQNQQLPGNIVNCSHLNQTLTAKVRHVETGNLCFGSILPKDYLPPVIACSDKFIACTADTAAQTLGFPTVSDNCTPLNSSNLRWSNQKTDLPCMTMQGANYVTAKIERTWTTADAQGNPASCKQTIWVKRATLANVVFPPNRDDFAAPALTCGQNPNDLALTGQPTVEGRAILVDGDCELLVAASDQNVNNCPPASYRVLRTWTVSDYCASTFSIHVQVIKVDDKIPPVLTAPADLTIGTNPTACSATVTLPQASATDNCSTFTIEPKASFGNGYGPFSGVLPGDHVITYVATDACGNSSAKTMLLTVEDDDAPSAICKNSIQLNLPAGGGGNLNATSLDDGSTDNCGLAPFTAARPGGNFAATVPFTCADIGSPVAVTLKVVDNQGFENTCLVQVNVRDNLKPTIQCPTSQTMTCQAASTAPAATGSPLVSDNCGTPAVDFSDVSNLSNCNVGNILRTWKATDNQGNTSTCTQPITLILVNTLTVQFPADKNLNLCATPDDLAPAATGQPSIGGQTCQPVSVTFTDEKISPAPPGCFNILRKWKVIDFCVWNPNGGSGGPGYFEHIQVIRVSDNTAPAIAPLADLTVSPGLPNCQAQVVLPDLQVLDCSDFSVFNNSPFANSPGKNASGIYPAGSHTVVFTATDGCGNSRTATQKITVTNCNPASYEVRGSIKTESNIPVPGIPVNLRTDGLNQTDDCDLAGEFFFDDIPGGPTYTLKPANNNKWLNGVTTLDLLAISKHILGVAPIASPQKMIAADANRSGSITTFDIVTIRKLILGILDTVPGNTSWRFVPTTHVFPDPTNAFATPFPEQINLAQLAGNQQDKNFTGIKIGDVNGSANAADARTPGDTVFVLAENLELREGYPLHLPVKISDWKDLDGFQFDLNFDTSKAVLLDIVFPKNGVLDETHVGRRNERPGQISIAWDAQNAKPLPGDSTLFTLIFNALDEVPVERFLKISGQRISAEAYRNGNAAPSEAAFRTTENLQKRGRFSVLQNHPNPFSERTTVPFWLPVPTEASLLVCDAMGKTVFQKTERFPGGYNEIGLWRGDLPGDGVYFYYLKTAETPGAGGVLVLRSH